MIKLVFFSYILVPYTVSPPQAEPEAARPGMEEAARSRIHSVLTSFELALKTSKWS